MAGVPSAVLAGWAMPALNMRIWDHTYVTSSCGLKWGCWGRDGGASPPPLDAANGSSIVADCLSQPNSQAGIVYWFTGVCHQTANRILHPAKITTFGCRGFDVSVFTWGTYGIGRWPEKARCYGPTRTTVAATPGGRGTMSMSEPESGNMLARKKRYHRAVSQAHSTLTDENLIRMKELAALVEAKLGEPLAPAALASLAGIQQELRHRHAELAQAVSGGAITPDQCLTSFNEALGTAMEKSLALLGADRFRRIFGEQGYHPEGLVVPETFHTQATAIASRRR